MVKSNNSKKKTAKKEKNVTQKKILKARVLIPIICAVVAACLTFGIIKIVQYNKSKTLQIAFYDLPEPVSESLKNVISEKLGDDVEFVNLTPLSIDKKRLNKRFDLVFSYDGALNNSFTASIEKISKKCYSNQPSSFYQDDAQSLDICLNHFEFDYSISRIQSLDIEYPKTLDDLDAFLSEMTKYVFCPFIMAGSNDKLLLGFFSCFVESLGGSKGYNAFINKASELFASKSASDAFAELLEYEIPAANNQPLSLKNIIDTLKKWPIKGYTHPSWYLATDSDVEIFMETGHVASIFTSLEEHRKMSYANVSKFESTRFPNQTPIVPHGVIMPAVSVIKFTNTADINNLLNALVSSDVQEIISRDTKLAPTSSRGQSYDRQADDVRFWAAACNDGPLPDLYNAVFQLNPTLGHECAQLFREELSK